MGEHIHVCANERDQLEMADKLKKQGYVVYCVWRFNKPCVVFKKEKK